MKTHKTPVFLTPLKPMENPGNPQRDLLMEKKPLAWVRPYEGNAKHHPPEQVERLAASIRRFGFNSPLLCLEDGLLVAGHGRLAAAAMVGLTEVPVVILRGMGMEEARAYSLADNRLGELGVWDGDALEAELMALGDADPSLVADAGFNPAEVSDLLGQTTADEMDSEEVPPPFTCPHCGRVIGDDE